MIKLPPWTRRTSGRHRITDKRSHQGWEGRENELRLLAQDPHTATTMPIAGLPIEPETHTCPVDQCPWPETPGDHQRPGGLDFWLLEHLRTHPPLDFLRTITRLRRANTKLQEQL